MGKSSMVPAGARVFCLRMLALLLSLPCDSSVGSVTFNLNGFQEDSIHVVSNSSWIFNTATGCLKFAPGDSDVHSLASGRFLYLSPVRMIHPGSKTVKSFSTSFIFQLRIVSSRRHGYLGPGLAFIMVPDNITLGAPRDYMGLITKETFETAKNYESDDHTFGVELDTFRNSEFQDINSNHIGINSASMNSIYSFKLVRSLASSSVILHQQVWIDYFEADSRMDIYIANYNEGKPAKPQGSLRGLDLSLLKEHMFIGFSSAHKFGSVSVPYVCAWSFSNDGNPAPPISLAQDATPSASPPPASDGLFTAAASNPSPSNPAHPPPPSRVQAPRGPNSELPTIAKEEGRKKNLIGVYVKVFVLLVVIVSTGIITWMWCRFKSRYLRIFISQAGGPDGFEKQFPSWLDKTMRKWPWSVDRSRVKIFFDKQDIEMGKSIAKEILRELARFDVAVVVVTDAFFKAKWPMTELIAFVEAQKNDPTERIRVLPLFYELSPEQIRAHLAGKTWDGNWEEMSKGSHPLQVEKCREAVTWLCQQRGIPYGYKKRDHDIEYIERICKEVDRILCKERSFKSYLIGEFEAVKAYCIPSRSEPGMTIHESEMTLLYNLNHMTSGSNTPT